MWCGGLCLEIYRQGLLDAVKGKPGQAGCGGLTRGFSVRLGWCVSIFVEMWGVVLWFTTGMVLGLLRGPLRVGFCDPFQLVPQQSERLYKNLGHFALANR